MINKVNSAQSFNGTGFCKVGSKKIPIITFPNQDITLQTFANKLAEKNSLNSVIKKFDADGKITSKWITYENLVKYIQDTLNVKFKIGKQQQVISNITSTKAGPAYIHLGDLQPTKNGGNEFLLRF